LQFFSENLSQFRSGFPGGCTKPPFVSFYSPNEKTANVYRFLIRRKTGSAFEISVRRFGLMTPTGQTRVEASSALAALLLS